MINRLSRDRLLDHVPEEQLMRVTEPDAARALLQRVYSKQMTSSRDDTDVDDQALIYRLVETSYGKAESWGVSTLRNLQTSIVSQLPGQFLSGLSGDAVKGSIDKLRDVRKIKVLIFVFFIV